MNKKYKFFWGDIYSNWYKAKMHIKIKSTKIQVGYVKQFNCVEQYMMYMKAITFSDFETAEKILEESNPREQKKLGRKVKNFDSIKWDAVKYDIVYIGVREKFLQNASIREELLKEDCDLFVEASPYDKVWGIGLNEKDAIKTPESEWKGENLLGKIITQVRDELKL